MVRGMRDNKMIAYTTGPAAFEHIPFLAAVEQAAATVFPPGSIPGAIRADSLPLPLLEQAVSLGNLRVAVAEEGTPVGFALLREIGGLAVLAEIDVRPEYAGQGIGRTLLAQVALRAKELGHDALYLTTFSHVPWNAPFYARLGFSLLREEAAPGVMRDILATEKAHGLEHRVAMRLML